MKETCTTTAGRTQCARTRGNPVARVKGDFAVSSLSRRARISSRSLVLKPVPTLPAKHEVVSVEVAHQQRAEANTGALRIREAAHNQFLRRLTFHLQPVWRSSVL